MTKIIDNLNTNKNREYEFDALGRLTKAKGGTTGTLWNQTYSYDRYGNRTNVTASGTAADSSPIPLDGIPNLSYDNASNRITTSGYLYDVAGNLIRSLAEDGTTWLKYEYDAANRLQAIRKDDANQTLVQAFQFTSTNARLIDYRPTTTGFNYFYCSVGGTVMAEYTEINGVFTWTKSNTYLGDTQLATITPNGSGGETVEFNHPDRLGARLKTNQSAGTSKEQTHLPFGTALNAESTVTDNNKRFTSYDRSPSTGLDYAINRTYDSKLGRFTQIDPIRMNAVSFSAPQTLNMYNYCGNDPINYTDPSGLFFGKLFKSIGNFFKKAWKWIALAVTIALTVVAIVATSGAATPGFLKLLGSVFSKLGIASFMAGGETFAFSISWTGIAMIGASTAGAIANSFQAKEKKKKDKPNKYVVYGVGLARAILSGNNDCSKFFGKQGLAALDDLEAQLKTGPVNNPDGTTNTSIGIQQAGGAVNFENKATGAKFRRWGTATVNTNGPFLNPRSTSKPGGYFPLSRQSRVLQILHEVAHKVPNPSGQGGLIPDDGGDTRQSEANTDEILKYCKSEIDKIK